MKSAHSISAIVPIYNERAAVPGAIQDIDAFLDAHFSDYEIVVVESGSTDGTGEACDALPGPRSRVRVIHEGARNGFGSAIRTGVAAATKRWIWPVVVDMPFSLEVMLTALPYLDTCGAVISYRSDDPRSLYRRFQSVVFNTLARRLLRVRARHLNSAFKVADAALMRSLALRSNGWLIDAELIMRMEQRGVRYVEIPVPLVDRTAGRSTIGPGASVKAARDLLALAFRRSRDATPVANGPGATRSGRETRDE